MKKTVETAYSLGQVVKHKYLDFRGVIYDVDPEFNNTEEWFGIWSDKNFFPIIRASELN